MLTQLLKTHRKQVDNLACSWLGLGVKMASLYAGEHLLAQWPPNAALQLPDRRVAIQTSGGHVIGELRVAGADDDAFTHLAAAAALLGSMAEMNDELDNMASALGESEDQLLALYELTKSDTHRLDIDYLIDSLAREAMRLVKAESAFVFLAPNHEAHTPKATLATEHLASLLAQLNDAGGDLLLTPKDVSFTWKKNARNLFVTPVLNNTAGETVACLGLWLGRAAATLSPDLKLARSIAEQAGAQLEIALLHQEVVAQARVQTELDLARQVQLGLLPKRPPKVKGLEIFADCRPALQVGGDFYDYYVTQCSKAGESIAFCVGDVSGKGMSAALLMTMMRTTLRVVASQLGLEQTPEGMLCRANIELYDDFSEVGMMATIFVGQYDAERKELTYANAGHSPVIFCPTDGPPQLLEADGPILGALPTCLSQNQRVPFNRGDLLVIFSDGFNEARNLAGDMFGIERLQELLGQNKMLSAFEIGQRLFAEIARFSSGHIQDDDQTLLVVKGV